MTEQPAPTDVEIRAYDREADRESLWELKRGFERGIGEGTGGDEKAATYEAKLTADYRDRWLAWVDRCVDDDPECVVVAVAGDDASARDGANAGGDVDGADDGATAESATETDSVAASGTDSATGTESDGAVVGYAFVLPESLTLVWDAAVLNEIYVAPDYRGTGVADALLDAAIERARSQDLPLDRMVLDVDRENERARAFYERCGFDHWGEMVAREL